MLSAAGDATDARNWEFSLPFSILGQSARSQESNLCLVQLPQLVRVAGGAHARGTRGKELV